jgi:hypothetical protein
MSTDDRSASRAEARRRARLAARGELDEPEPDEPDPEPRRARGGFLTRIFPPAPPLPNRPDPLAGYAGDGPLRPISERVFLLRRNPLAWLVPALAAFVGLIASLTYGSSIVGLIGTFLLFGSLIAAGWFGWQRPTLYGTAAALLGYLIALSLIFFSFSSRGAGAETFGTATQVIGGFVLQGIYYSGLGFVGGWYGGYLRRRQTQLSAARQPPRRRR